MYYILTGTKYNRKEDKDILSISCDFDGYYVVIHSC